MITACGSSTSTAGIILVSTGNPFAEKEMILVALLLGDQVAITSARAGGVASLVVPLTEWKSSTGDIVYGRGFGGTPSCRAGINAAGEFSISNFTPGKYVLLWLGSSGNVYPIGANGEYIRVEVQEGQNHDLGILTLMSFSEPILK